VHLAVLIDGDDPYDCLGLVVPGHEHHAPADSGGIAGIAEHRPAEPLAVFGIEVGAFRQWNREPTSGARTATLDALKAADDADDKLVELVRKDLQGKGGRPLSDYQAIKAGAAGEQPSRS
jgi:hypothetical protein